MFRININNTWRFYDDEFPVDETKNSYSLYSAKTLKVAGDRLVITIAGQLFANTKYSRGKRELSMFSMQGFDFTIDWDNYVLNGMKMNKTEMCLLLARMFIYDSQGNRTRENIRDMFWKYSEVTEDVRYALENRMPFHFWHGGRRIDCRLNCKMISETELAVEVSDGIWGQMSIKEATAFLSYFLQNKRRNKKWVWCSPSKLYQELLDKEPSDSDLKVMIAFLEQNRTEDLINKRALELVKSKLNSIKNFELLVGDLEDGEVRFFVRGKLRDYILITNLSAKRTSTQDVSTLYLNPRHVCEECDRVKSFNKRSCEYCESHTDSRLEIVHHSLCIDNTDGKSSRGDQLITRMLAVLNDSFSKTRISTMSSLTKSTLRVNEKGLEFMRKNIEYIKMNKTHFYEEEE